MGQTQDFVGPICFFEVRNLEHRQVKSDLVRNGLRRMSGDIVVLKSGAQNLVAVDHRIEALTEGSDVKFSGQAQGLRDVVGRTLRLKLVQYPQPLLRKRQRSVVSGRAKRKHAGS